MRSRKLVLGTLVFAVLAAAAVVSLAVGQEVLAAAVAVVMIAAVGVLVLDVATTLRRTERQLKRLAKNLKSSSSSRPAAAAPTVVDAVGPVASEADLMGTVRLLQAQYVGRLDRAESMLETAVDRLADGRRD